LHVVDRAEDEASPGGQVIDAAFDLVRDLLRRAERKDVLAIAPRTRR
jgi:cob(I)alamin adenosyltransferase